MNMLQILAPAHMQEAFLLEDAYVGRAVGTGLKSGSGHRNPIMCDQMFYLVVC